MTKFVRLGKDISILAGHFSGRTMPFCEMSLGEKYLWRDAFVVDWARTDDGGLLLKETSQEYGYIDAFYYPERQQYLKTIEDYAKGSAPLTYCYLTEDEVERLRVRYPAMTATYDRDTSDYFYLSEDFRYFKGKKFSGQRNHINKFSRTYPTAFFKVLGEEDIEAVAGFLSRYVETQGVTSHLEEEEVSKIMDFVQAREGLGVVGGVIYLDGAVIALTLGEVVGDTLVVHVEKALREYSGVYPTIASAFVKNVTTPAVVYVNREEDCGEIGLRTSKLQYHPIEIRHKYLVKVDTSYALLDEHIEIKTDRLTLKELEDNDKNAYFSLYTDEDVNKYYGYDYREDIGDNQPSPQYFFAFQQGLKDKREEYSLAVKIGDVLIGEVVLYNADFLGGIEIGFRFFREYQGQGYAYEATGAVIDYLKTRGFKKVVARHYPQNLPSQKLLTKLGFSKVREDDKYYFYEYEI